MIKIILQMLDRIKFSLFLFVPQVIFIILYGVLIDYDSVAGGIPFNTTESHEFQTLYPSKFCLFCVRKAFKKF